MKKLLILLFIILFMQGINAQDYVPMLGNTSIWYYIESGLGIDTDVFIAKDDTVFNNLSYRILSKAHDGQDIYEQSTIVGYIREDTVEKRVYMLPYSINAEDNTEFIYYDFSLNEGDSLLLYGMNYYSYGYFILDSIRNISTIAGSRRTFYYSHYSSTSSDKPIWVEGIGTLGSMRERIEMPWFEVGSGITCYFKDGIKLYQSPLYEEYDTCVVLRSSVEKFCSTYEINIFPNPASSKINIQLKNNFPFNCYFYNLEGKVLISIKNQTNIDISNLSPGMYFYKLINMDNGRVHCGKILKE